jgi:hypothetical protein
VTVALAPLGVCLALAAFPGRRSAPERLLIVTAAALVAIALVVRPAVADGLTARSLAAHINAQGHMPRRVWIVDEGVGSFVFYLRHDLRRGLRPQQVQRISRFATPDVLHEPGDGVIAVASDRVDGLADVLDLTTYARPPAGQFLILPVAGLRARR